jgi:anaerobic magnesium-protoporphyrin IX monomethyl ester cyclase
MHKKVILIQSPWITINNTQNIGLAYVAAVLKKEGCDIHLFDQSFDLYNKITKDDKKMLDFVSPRQMKEFSQTTISKYSDLISEFTDKLIEIQPDYIGFSICETNAIISLFIAQNIKKINKNIKIIFGGPSCFPLISGNELVQNDCIDLIVYGEADRRIIDILNHLSNNKDVAAIKGLLYKKDNKIYDTGFPESTKNLDDIPFPALELFNISNLNNKIMHISFNRGCMYNCEYCDCRSTRQGLRSRSPVNIFNEIRYRLDQFPGNKHFYVCDSSVTALPEQIDGLCDLIIGSHTEVKISGFATPHKAINIDLIYKMKRAGFEDFVFGVESGSDRILQTLGKKFTSSYIENTIINYYNAGFDNIGIDILVGLPGENEDDFQATIQFLQRNIKYIKRVGINYFTVYPYSYIYFHKNEFKFVPEDIILERFNRLNEIIGMMKLNYTMNNLV